MPFDIAEKSKQYWDAINKEEIHNILRVIAIHVEKSSGKDLELLKKYLKKIVDY